MVTKEQSPQIIAIGEVVFDILPESRKIGGAPVDFLRYAVKSGAKAGLISAIGADDLGREVVSELAKFEIEPVTAVTPYPTGRVLIFKNPSGVPVAHILENAAWDYIPFTDAAEMAVKKADAVYFGTLALRKAYSRNTVLDLLDCVKQGAYRFFDVNLRQEYYNKELITALLERADILKLNLEELKIIKTLLDLHGTSEDICLKLKEKYDLKYVILTDAAKESRVYGKELTSVKNTRIRQIFSYGAGNAFAGAFMAALLQNKSQEEAHLAANLAAVEVCRTVMKGGFGA